MADISKEDLKKEIQEILKDADLDNTSAKKVRLQLQEKLDCDLAERKKEVDQLVMEVIDEQTQEDEEDAEDEEEESGSEDEPPKKKKPVSRKKAASASGSDYSPEGSEDEEEVPSDGGGSDYEPDQPVGRGGGRGRAKLSKKKTRRDSDDESSGEEWGWGGRKKSSSGKKSRKRKDSSDEDDSDYEKPKPKRTNKGGGGKGNGYTAPVKLSSELADIVGGEEMPRHEVVKRMWQYIKENKLQDPKNKQFIKCDEKLSKVIPTKKFRGFGMAKYLKDHMNVE